PESLFGGKWDGKWCHVFHFPPWNRSSGRRRATKEGRLGVLNELAWAFATFELAPSPAIEAATDGRRFLPHVTAAAKTQPGRERPPSAKRLPALRPSQGVAHAPVARLCFHQQCGTSWPRSSASPCRPPVHPPSSRHVHRNGGGFGRQLSDGRSAE